MLESYGSTFREIRKQKGFTLQELAEGIVSVSFLSKFERDQSEISLSLFKLLLSRLAVSFDEFFYLHNENADHFEKFFKRIQEAYLEEDVSFLEQMKYKQLSIWKNTKARTARCNVIAIERLIDLIKKQTISSSDEDIQFLYDFLFNVEVWGKYELLLYNLTMHLLPIEMVITLSRTAYKKSARYQGMKNGKQMVATVLLNTMVTLTGIPNQTVHPYAEEFLNYLEQINLDDVDIAEKLSRKSVRGYYELKTGNISKGEEIIRAVISFYRTLESHQLADKEEKYLEFYLNHIKLRKK
ncbi:Rgg/GadR/MutR family transcriptional regulator [Filobacillus milosensis]|uniref:Rgg/GadR/MutR family transcriptional regulator n=1 Tax=Filobacillus milosensis TaxID=94137 RepID=A0A4Y8IGM0_9BACI|nr:Rgg/GadR/MutR family transcriptional regulator [Filobacillus milosensis]TFB14264.1 Rgg/GadR/MutR family transcriptional regulator [Filobacillus milosensis]